MASRYYMINQSANAREGYVAASRNQMMHLAALAEPVNSVGCLVSLGGVPPPVEQEDIAGELEIQTDPAGAIAH